MSVDLDQMFEGIAGLPTVVERPQIAKLRYSHEAMIEMIVAEPSVAQFELARRFGMTQSWISTIINSDAFQVQLHKRMGEVWGPLTVSMQDQMKGLMARSMEILREKLDRPAAQIPDQLALRSFELTSRAAGYGARDASSTVNINVSAEIDDAGDQLIHLLRRKKAEVIEGEIVNEAP